MALRDFTGASGIEEERPLKGQPSDAERARVLIDLESDPEVVKLLSGTGGKVRDVVATTPTQEDWTTRQPDPSTDRGLEDGA